jgi:fructose-specific phosphotransferase system component IIB
LAQDVRREDQSHHVFDAALLHDLMNHREQANLHVGVESSGQMACEVHLQMDDVHQSALGVLLALDY